MVRKKVARKAHALRGELYRDLVLEAAEREFASHGFAEARMQRVADEVGLSVGTLYNLFESKDALHAAIHKLRGDALMVRVMVALEGGQPGVLDTLEKVVRIHVGFCAEHPHFLRLLLHRGDSWASPSPDMPPSALKGWKRGIAATVALCQAGIDRGELSAEDPLRMVMSFSAVHQAQLRHWLDTELAEPGEQVAARIIALFQRMYAR